MTATPAPPTWLLEAEAALRADLPSWFTDFAPPPDPQRRSAVLIEDVMQRLRGKAVARQQFLRA